jgi:UDP-N-acetylglucosamine 1-carboxyvinyltransferase
MDKIKITGGRKLQGTIEVGGSKNAALPILFSVLLSDEKSRFQAIPDLQDIRFTIQILEHLGVSPGELRAGALDLSPDGKSSCEAEYDLVRKMRASVLTLGPLVAKYGYGKVSLPGGCAIGARPINFHLSGLEKLGAEIQLEEGYVIAKAKRLQGNRIAFDFPSVGATENILMAATLAKGETMLENAAKEPEIVDLARSLRSMGAKIQGEGTSTIHVQGVDSLKGADYRVMGDRIQAGTYLAAAVVTGGSVTVKGLEGVFLESVLEKFKESGVHVSAEGESISVTAPKGSIRSTDIQTLPYPGFPTDMQAQFMAMMCLGDGTSVVTETIFENRFMHVPELQRFGADIQIRGNTAVVKGVKSLRGAPVMATDLRASASLIIAGLAAEGETVIHRIYHLDRGYEDLEGKLSALGAQVERVKTGDV